MSFFGTKLWTGLSSNGPSSAQSSNPSTVSGAETVFLKLILFLINFFLTTTKLFFSQIERLCERVQSSVLVEDRKESLKEIKKLSQTFKLEVGTQAMPILIDVLKNNR